MQKELTKQMKSHSSGEIEFVEGVDVKDMVFDNVGDVDELVEVEHYFSDGVYMKYGVMKQGFMIMGYPHKTKHMNMLISGTITLSMDGAIKQFTAPCMIESQIGTAKIGYTNTEVIMAEIHPTDETDIEKLEDMLLDKNMTKEHLDMFNDFHKELKNDSIKWLGT